MRSLTLVIVHHALGNSLVEGGFRVHTRKRIAVSRRVSPSLWVRQGTQPPTQPAGPAGFEGMEKARYWEEVNEG